MHCRQAGLILAMMLSIMTAARAQEKESTEKPPALPEVQMTVQVVLSEYDGEKKISSLPYTVPVRGRGQAGRVRMGLRVPVAIGSAKEGMTQSFQYMDIGTNIDCNARESAGGQFYLDLTVERNSIYTAEGRPVESATERFSYAAQPIVRHYRASMELLMKDGQTVQRSVATDPLSGRVLKVDVTLNVVK